jgi:O-antigen ligase
VLLAFYFAGPEVRARFLTVFGTGESRDASAQSRLDLWRDCLDVMSKRPLLGVGPDHWQLVVHEYGWPPGKLAHSLWLQIGAEIGIVGLLLLMTYYVGCAWRLASVLLRPDERWDPWLPDAARMVVAAIVGFIVAAQFVSLDRLEVPYYVALIGAGVLKLTSLEPVADTPPDSLTAPRPTALASAPA